MSSTVTIEIPADCEALVRQLLGLHEELQHLALTAADGTVLDVCEAAVLHKGRDLNATLLADVVARRIAAAEKKGRRAAPAAAGGRGKIGGGPRGNS
jgi:hypothetical protein